ncbi:aminoglycoside phosphotransferase family protein [Kibdelosporangium philippinense]|uniref:Aminoglycoside phosphotransferase family protein n=1 Tax=Kibdelosporangium philippinense TaxID=211113 RepID=A0ABS8ZS59_9PSEU|nr:aminoglycoside phosphotransferase family protein [Kibdelosporangium philippinense]MCE7010551.1 aminoglycoside phosphotransferase family protein [Kibdelosporangium philippinense]
MSVDIAADPPDLDQPPNPAITEAVSAAEAVLRRRYGAKIQLAEPEDLGGSKLSTVVRVRVAATPFSLPRTLVVKRYSPPMPSEAFVREAVSYQLFTALTAEERMCPELYAHDGAAGVIVIEDLGRAPTLADKLLGDDARAAERALLSWARSLGRLHATTAGREADFDALMRRLSSAKVKGDPLAVNGPAAIERLPQLLDDVLGVHTPAHVFERAERTRWLLATSRHRGFSPSDLCPDNNLITSRGVRFLDFEGGCVRNIMLDAAYLRVPFPSCWCAFALPAGMTDAMFAAWRAEVRVMWPDLADDSVVLPRMLDAQLFWVWASTFWFLPRPGEQDGPIDSHLPSPRRTVSIAARWQHLRDEAARAGADNIVEHAKAVVDALTKKFGPDLKLPMYPAFR